MKRGVSFFITSIMLAAMLLNPVQAKEQSELERFQDFMLTHPKGGMFTLQQDLIMEEDVVINTKGATYHIQTNGYQVQMMDWSTFTSYEGEDWWDMLPYDNASVVIEGDASQRPLVLVYGDAYFNNVEVHATNGDAVVVEDGCFNVEGTMDGDGFFSKVSTTDGVALTLKENGDFYQDDGTYFEASARDGIAIDVYQGYGFFGKNREATKAIATGANAIGVRFHTPYQEEYYAPTLSNLAVQVTGEAAIGVQAPWLRLSYITIDAGANASISDIIRLAAADGEILLNGVPYQAFQIKEGRKMGSLRVPAAMSYASVPLPSLVNASVYDVNGNKAEVLLRLVYDQAAFEAGMISGQPFTLQAKLHQSDAMFYTLGEDVQFTIDILPQMEPLFAMYIQVDPFGFYQINMERPYGAQHVYVYQSEDGVTWSEPFQDWASKFDSIHDVTGLPTPYVSINGKSLPADVHYLKVAVIGGYLDGKSATVDLRSILKGEDDPSSAPPDDFDDGGQGGNEGQGGGREDSGYQPSTPNDSSQITNEEQAVKDKASDDQNIKDPIIKNSAQQETSTGLLAGALCLGLLVIIYRRMFSKS